MDLIHSFLCLPWIFIFFNIFDRWVLWFLCTFMNFGVRPPPLALLGGSWLLAGSSAVACSAGSCIAVVLESDGYTLACGDSAAFPFQLLQHNTFGC